ncbi:unnamed protein product [Brachionus calyciflorus]|uniref:Uncharacterized protein n=1 Tax=Brachionus calyciflorus TaxID=104777 RepID=A0A813VCQ3_9BILA|nr:unnamed protein product [Brachionus calyciflorus]
MGILWNLKIFLIVSVTFFSIGTLVRCENKREFRNRRDLIQPFMDGSRLANERSLLFCMIRVRKSDHCQQLLEMLNQN